MSDMKSTATVSLSGFAPERSKAADRWVRAFADIRGGFAHWQLWWLLGRNDIQQRYRRSIIGQFWITLSMAAFIGAIGSVYGILFKAEMREYIPHLAVNFVVWTYIAGTLNDACVVFTHAETFLRQERLPKTVFVLRVMLRNIIILAHNALLIPLVMIAFGVELSWTILLFPIGLALVTLNLLLMSVMLGVVCTRFRDMPQIVGSLLQIAFFVSPVMWQRNLILQSFPAVVDLNPFAHHLVIIADPILGKVPAMSHYWICLAVTFVLACIVVPFFARYRERIVYWL